MRVDGVGVGMMPAKILQRGAILHRARRKAEALFQNLMCVRPGDGVHGVKAHGQAARHRRADGVEIEQAFHQRGIIGHRIDHLHAQPADLRGADRVEINVRRLHRAPLRDGGGALIDRLGHALGRGAAIGDVIFDAEIFLRPAGIVAGRQHEAAAGLVLPNHIRRGGRGQNAPLPHQHARIAIGRRDADHLLDHGAIVITAIAAHHQSRLVGPIDHIKHALDKVFRVIGLRKHLHLLAQPGRARFLPRERRGGMGDDRGGLGHRGSLVISR